MPGDPPALTRAVPRTYSGVAGVAGPAHRARRELRFSSSRDESEIRALQAISAEAAGCSCWMESRGSARCDRMGATGPWLLQLRCFGGRVAVGGATSPVVLLRGGWQLIDVRTEGSRGGPCGTVATAVACLVSRRSAVRACHWRKLRPGKPPPTRTPPPGKDPAPQPHAEGNARTPQRVRHTTPRQQRP